MKLKTLLLAAIITAPALNKNTPFLIFGKRVLITLIFCTLIAFPSRSFAVASSADEWFLTYSNFDTGKVFMVKIVNGLHAYNTNYNGSVLDQDFFFIAFDGTSARSEDMMFAHITTGITGPGSANISFSQVDFTSTGSDLATNVILTENSKGNASYDLGGSPFVSIVLKSPESVPEPTSTLGLLALTSVLIFALKYYVGTRRRGQVT